MQTVSIQLGTPSLEAFAPSPELVSADALGIELELEGFTPQSTDEAARLVSPLWTIVPDGSLRNGGVEFITTGGLGGERLAAAINQLQGALEVVNYDASWRCSTHMHVNMLDFTVNQVVRFLLVYTACEPVLFNFCGAYRKTSNFCTPVIDSLPFHRKIMSRMWDDAVTHRWPTGNCNKYVALNLLPLFPDQRGRALGTVEFRGGRPLVSREEMFKQANLLLSIKDYVRNFVGTEEEMLTALAGGLTNTVYANGVSAGLEPSVDELEASLIASWMLLKSYQEGQTNRRSALEQNRQPVPEVAGMNWQPAFQPRVRQRPDNNPSHLPSIYLNGDLDDLDDLRSLANGVWPAIIEYYETLRRTSNRAEQVSAAFMCLRSRSGTGRTISWANYSNAILNWAGHLTPTSDEQTPIPTMIRLRNAVVSNELHEEPLGLLPGSGINGVRPSRICYQQELGEARWAELLTRIGYTASAKNIDVWTYLATHRVRSKGRDSIQTALNNVGVPLNVTETMSTFQMYNALRYTGKASAAHVWSSDIAAYDNFCYVLSILQEAMLHIPVIRQTSFSNAKCNWTKVNGAMGMDLAGSIVNKTRDGQTPARTMTGVSIY